MAVGPDLWGLGVCPAESKHCFVKEEHNQICPLESTVVGAHKLYSNSYSVT